jgi:prolipoprotein diacylglyceryl transferase
MFHFVWSLDPEFARVGSISIRWYSVWTAAALIIAHHVFRFIWQKEGRRVMEADFIIVVAVLFSVVGARLGHCLFYHPTYYLAHPMDILKLWQGGLASHGGFLGLFVGLALIVGIFSNISFLQLADRFMISAGIVSVGLRLGNLFNSEIYGKPTHVPWAIIFSRVDEVPRHPTQIYEFVSYAIILAILVGLYKRPKFRTKPGFILGSALILYPAFRMVVEFTKEGQSDLDKEWLFSMGQILSLPFALLGCLLLMGIQERAPQWFSGHYDLRDAPKKRL